MPFLLDFKMQESRDDFGVAEIFDDYGKYLAQV